MKKLTNEELAMKLSQEFNAEMFNELFSRFTFLIYKNFGRYRIKNYDLEDYKQESRIVLLQSITRYDASRSCYFASFFDRNLRNRLSNLQRIDFAQKRGYGQVILSYHSLISQDSHDGDFLSGLPDLSYTAVEERIVVKEKCSTYLNSLSLMERQVLQMYLDGQSRSDIAESLELNSSQINNALDRCKMKLKKLFKI